MTKYCSNCGSEIIKGSEVCLECGKFIHSTNKQKTTGKGRGISTVSVIFGSLGFWPLIFIGSIVGFITSVLALTDSNNTYKNRSKIGLILSLISLIVWILLLIIFNNRQIIIL